jgi:cytoskeletal protein CcmA (bactofilin family)
VEIHTPARVRGNISTPSLSIDKGVIFDGQCQMEGNGAPTAKARPAGAAAPPPTVD